MAKYLAKKHVRFPGWIFLLAMALYTELILHFWTTETIVFGRLAAVVVFAMASGTILGLISSLLPPKVERWFTVIVGALMGVLCLLEFFIDDAYGVFMPLISVLTSAKGVATGYFSIVVSLLARNLWRIALVMFPPVVYGIFIKNKKGGWVTSAVLAAVSAVLVASGFGIVYGVNLDVAQLKIYNFDGAIHSFGLNTALVMDVFQGSGSGEESLSFEIPVSTTAPATSSPTEAPTQATEATQPEDPVETTAPVETEAPTEPPRVYEPHELGLDFAALAETETKKDIAAIHSYIASQEPEMENDYTGLFEGKNLILITAEALSLQVIDPELSPTLYRMLHEGIYFSDYYHPLLGAGTTGGEFANLVSVIPYNGTATMEAAINQDLFLTMGNQLQKEGYTSYAFHNNDHTFYNRDKTHTHLGYDTFFAHGNGMEDLISNVWTRSDQEMIDVTVPMYIDKQPFSVYYMTVSGHSSYDAGNAMSQKNMHMVEDLPYSYGVKCYLAASLELEHAMASLIQQLEEAGIADDTVVVITTDHYPYGLESSETWGNSANFLAELYGTYNITERVRDQNALIIWSGCLEDKDIVVDDPVWMMDILPTLSNLFGVEYDSRLMVGRDVFSDSDPLVFWPLSYSWKTDKGYYNGSTGVFTPEEGVDDVSKEYIDAVAATVRNKVLFSKGVQWYSYFNYITKALEELGK